MSKFVVDSMPSAGAIAARWWAPVVRGIAAILFGIIALASPGPSLLALLFVWGSYAIVDGVLHIALAVRRGRTGRNWGWLLFAGIVGIAAGVVTFVWPGITAVVLLVVLAAWAVMTGVAEIVAAVQLRRKIEGEWLLGASGVLSIVFGVGLFAYPDAGALAVVYTVGVFAIMFGVLIVGFGLRLQRWGRDHEHPMPTGGTATPV